MQKRKTEIQTVGKIMNESELASKTGIRTNLSTRQSPNLCACGNSIEPILLSGDLTHRPSICSVCRERNLQQQIRADRGKKVAELNQRIASVIPPLFRDAHLRDLNYSFREHLLNFNRKTGLVLYGPVGTGKSHALCALARYLILTKNHVRRLSFEQLCLQVRDTFKNNGQSELAVINPLISAEILIAEDVGASHSIGQSETEFSVRLLLHILDSRLENCKPTLISTNQNKKYLAQSFDERVASRLSTFTWLGVGGKDKRIKNNSTY